MRIKKDRKKKTISLRIKKINRKKVRMKERKTKRSKIFD